jgi:4-amino-4-deoxy-L-arabinose transferase-like glycosyltransferase
MSRWGRGFWAAFAVFAFAKGMLAARLPLFGDEAWYWLEGQRMGWAYSDLPGLTAWLIRLGTELAGDNAFGVRWPFLTMSLGLPLLVGATAAAWGGEPNRRRAAWLALLMPLLGALGFLALPDVPLTLAAALCLLAIARLCVELPAPAPARISSTPSAVPSVPCVVPAQTGIQVPNASPGAAPQAPMQQRETPPLRRTDLALLTVGLVLGALSHYRFALIVAAGFVGLLLDANGRRLLRLPAVWIAIAIGALAWLPLLAWNFIHHGAGLAFQLAERHPWSPHAGGLWFLPMQLTIASPLLAVAGALALIRAWRCWRAGTAGPWGLALGTAGVPLLIYGALAFVADRERVSFHWTLQAWLPLLCLMPGVLAGWLRAWRVAAYGLAVAGLAGLIAYAGVAALPAARAGLADSRWYPDNFAGWHEIAAATRGLDDLAADNFMLGAQLAFARRDAALPILDHPLNRKHGRAVQLALWGQGGESTDARWLVLEDTAVPLRDRLVHYQALCRRLGDLPVARVLDLDHGRKRFLVLDLARRGETCRTPALAWIDAPAAGSVAPRVFDLTGWAFKDGVGIARVEVTLDGHVVAQADYGAPRSNVAQYWRVSRDPAQPDVGFEARVDARAFAPGEHWLGLLLHGRDGSVEPWPEQRLRLE